MVICTMYIKTDDMWNDSLYDIYLYVLVILSKKKKKKLRVSYSCVKSLHHEKKIPIQSAILRD